ncbi:MAG: hypothetical protein ACKKL5_03465 [Candidatus Komeilibacteria bacterium]
MSFEQPSMNNQLDKEEEKRQARNKDVGNRPGRKHDGWLDGGEWKEEEERIKANDPQNKKIEAYNIEALGDADTEEEEIDTPEDLSVIGKQYDNREKIQPVDEHRLDDNDGSIASAHFEAADENYDTDKLMIAREKRQTIH